MRGTGVRELTFRIVLEDPPAGVDFGLQIGRGAEYETVQTQRSKGKDLSFEFSVGVGAAGSKTSAPPDFQGPVVQGPPSQRFIYIDIGTYAGQRKPPREFREVIRIPREAKRDRDDACLGETSGRHFRRFTDQREEFLVARWRSKLLQHLQEDGPLEGPCRRSSSARLRSSSARCVLELTPVFCCRQCFAHFFFSMQT